MDTIPKIENKQANIKQPILAPCYVLMSGLAGHMYSWLAIARQEKIATFLGVYGYNPRWKYSIWQILATLDHPVKTNNQGAKIGCFIFACLFSILGIVSIHT